VQKNRCPFFFFELIFASLLTLSSSDTSTPSSSPPPISTSCEPTDCDDLCELSLIRRLGGVLPPCDGVKGVEGSGRWAARPPKLLRVGVFADGSSARGSSDCASAKNLLFGLGVVGVVSSPGRLGGGSGTASVVFTAWKVDMATGRRCTSVVGGRVLLCPMRLQTEGVAALLPTVLGWQTSTRHSAGASEYGRHTRSDRDYPTKSHNREQRKR